MEGIQLAASQSLEFGLSRDGLTLRDITRLFRLCPQVPLLPGERGGGTLEAVVDAEEDLLQDRGAQLV